MEKLEQKSYRISKEGLDKIEKELQFCVVRFYLKVNSLTIILVFQERNDKI